MKKITYIAAALLAFVGCAKQEIVPQTANSNNLEVSLAVGSTKAVYDGDSHIKFEENDQMYAALASVDKPTTGIEILGPTGYSTSCIASMKIDNEHLDAPVFSGSFKSMAEADKAEQYYLYGVFPYSALFGTSTYSTQNLTAWQINLPADQKEATQSTWSNKADVMLIAPVKIDVTTSVNADSDKYYDAAASSTVEFAHLFGFGQIKFADIPDEYKDLVVKSVKIETTDGKYLAGRYTVDVTKDMGEIVPKEGSYYNMSNTITLTGDGETKVSDYTAWFVANPGTYDVKITVSTKKVNFIFDRKGLEIKRGAIAAPTVHYKGTDKADVLDVTLKDGESWSVTKFDSQNYLSKANEGKAWGDAGSQKVIFSVSYPGTTNGVSPYYLWADGGGYVQKLAGNLVNGGKIVLASESEFKGMKYVMMNVGIYSANVSADFSVSVDNGTKVVELGKYTIPGTNKSTAGKDCYFKTTTESENGVLILTVDNLPKNEKDEYIYIQPYLGGIVVNPAPAIEVESTKIKVAKDAATGSFAVATYATEEKLTVTVADDAKSWLSASYADGKISYTVAENAGQKRTGVLTLKVGKASKDVSVVQASATEVEYKLAVTAKDLNAAITAAKAAGQTFNETDTFTATFTAKATDGSDKTKDVEIKFTNLKCLEVTDELFKAKATATIGVTSELGFVETVTVTCSTTTPESASSYSNLSLKLSSDGSDWKYFGGTYESGVYYKNTFTNTDESYTWFQINANPWGIVVFTGFEAVFIVG